MPMNPRLLRPTASSGFDPRKISGLAAWHDASDTTTVTLDSGRVASWADKSGNGRTMANGSAGSTQPDYISSGRNGRNVIRFSAASTQRLTAAAASTYNFLHNGTPSTVVVACKVGDSNNPQERFALMGSNGTSGSLRGFHFAYDDRTTINANLSDAFNGGVSSAAGVFVANSATLAAYKDVFLPNVYSLLTVYIDAANATASERIGFAQNDAALVKANTATASVSASNATFSLEYGGGANSVSPFTGDFCEVLMYEKLLSDAELAAVRKYLYQRWAITP